MTILGQMYSVGGRLQPLRKYHARWGVHEIFKRDFVFFRLFISRNFFKAWIPRFSSPLGISVALWWTVLYCQSSFSSLFQCWCVGLPWPGSTSHRQGRLAEDAPPKKKKNNNNNNNNKKKKSLIVTCALIRPIRRY